MLFRVLIGMLLGAAVTPAFAQVSGCSDPTMRPCYRDAEGSFYRQKTSKKSLRHRDLSVASSMNEAVSFGTVRRMGEGLRKIVAEGAGRVIAHPAGCPNPRCRINRSALPFNVA